MQGRGRVGVSRAAGEAARGFLELLPPCAPRPMCAVVGALSEAAAPMLAAEPVFR